jgi:two-component system cell cycle response regulator
VANKVAERIRRKIAGEPFPIVRGSRSVEVTISVGLACRLGPQDSAAVIMKRADAALYLAKGQGRNRVVSDAA